MVKEYRYDVFLGGSCGETTWRENIVIPRLKSMGITYFNPQKSLWTEDMIKIEDKAKRESRLIMFVIDSKQVSFVSMIEIAFLTAQNASLIIVLPAHEENDTTQTNNIMVDRELCLKFLRAILHRHHIPVYKSINEAMDALQVIIRAERNIFNSVADFRFAPGFIKEKLTQCAQRLMDWIFCLFACFYFLINFTNSTSNNLQQVRPSNTCLHKWSFSKFLCSELIFLLIFYFGRPFDFLPTILVWGLSIGAQFLIFFASLISHKHLRAESRSISNHNRIDEKSYDVYIGGSETHKKWIMQWAVPFLHEHGLSHWNSFSCELEQRIDMLSLCQSVLFVVESTDSLFTSIVELAYFAGTGFKVVGFIDVNIPNGLNKMDYLKNKEASCKSSQCYRRGLLYLTDMAQSKGVEITNDRASALRCVVQQARGGQKMTD